MSKVRNLRIGEANNSKAKPSRAHWRSLRFRPYTKLEQKRYLKCWYIIIESGFTRMEACQLMNGPSYTTLAKWEMESYI